MANKSSKAKYTSQGMYKNVSQKTLNSMKNRNLGDLFLQKFKAYLAGKNPWLTIENPNKNETAKKFIRIKAVDLYGSLKNRKPYIIPGS